LKRLLILGAGLSGVIAAGAVRADDVTILEEKRKGSSGLNDHFAIMRFRDQNIGRYLGCYLEEIIVRKSVLRDDGSISDVATIRESNQYSLKLYGDLSQRSLSELGFYKRFILTEDISLSEKTVHYGSKVKSISEGREVMTENGETFKYDICISTIPMAYTLALCGLSSSDEFSFESKRVAVWRADLKFSSTVHQTLYLPSPSLKAYRATIEGQSLIVEYIPEEGQGSLEHELEAIMCGFGIGTGDFKDERVLEQKLGKLIPIPDDLRKSIILKLTDDFNIYSLGRHAIWKSIRTDQLIKDIERIKEMINVGKERRHYESRIN